MSFSDGSSSVLGYWFILKFYRSAHPASLSTMAKTQPHPRPECERSTNRIFFLSRTIGILTRQEQNTAPWRGNMARPNQFKARQPEPGS
jgi:hypothetical protein